MTKTEALKLALEALMESGYYDTTRQREAIAAIKDVLAQSALKPCRSPYCECTEGKCTHTGCYDARHELFEFPEARPKQEPVSGQSRFIGEREWLRCSADHVRMILGTPQLWKGYEARYLYTTPPKRQPLTDEGIAEVYASIGGLDFYLNFARAIEAAHDIKEAS